MTTPCQSISVVIADDHPFVRQGVQVLLEHAPHMQVVGEAENGRDAVAKVCELSPEVLVIDISMPGINGIDATRQITRISPATRVIALSIHSGQQYIRDMFLAGAMGYLLKESAPEELIEAVRAVMRGEVFLSSAVAGKFVSSFFDKTPDVGNAAGIPGPMPAKSEQQRIIRSKLVRPAVPSNHIRRSRLIDRFHNGRKNPLTLVSAPAGYGKSLLASCWLQELDGPSAWLSLEKDDNDLRRFVTYLLAALDNMLPESVSTTRALLDASIMPSIDDLATQLIDELWNIDQDFVLVIDDLHHIVDTAILSLIGRLLEHAPTNLHLVLIGRRDLFLPISRMRAKALVTEIRTADLRFTAEETQAFLAGVTGTEIDIKTSMSWTHKTEGWITGLRLASLAVGQLGSQAFPDHLPDSVQYVLEYLFNEVLSRQTGTMRRYLLSSAVLDRFCAPLCEAVAPGLEKASAEPFNGWDFIAVIRQENLFTTNLGTDNLWYRYHNLFRRLLKNQLQRHYGESAIADLHIRASQWFADNGSVEEAIQHALLADDLHRAVGLVARYRRQKLDEDCWFLFENWLSLFPADAAGHDPELLIARLWDEYHHLRFEALMPLIESAETMLEGHSGSKDLRGELALFRGVYYAAHGDGSHSLDAIEKAREYVPERFAAARGLVDMYYGLASQLDGHQQRVVLELSELLLVPALPYSRRIQTVHALVLIHLIAGDLPAALRYNRQLRDMARHAGDLTSTAWSSYVRGAIHFQHNEMDAAIDHLNHAAESDRLLPLRAVTDTWAGLTLAFQAAGRIEKANEALIRLRRRAQRLGDLAAEAVADSCELRLSVMRGEKITPAGEKTPVRPATEAHMGAWLEVPEITRCRMLIAEGTASSLQEAENALGAFMDLNRRHHNTYQAVDIMVLLAVCRDRQGQSEASLQVLEEVLHLAEPGQWIRPFVLAGPAIADLLKQLKEKAVCTAYIEKLLTALDALQSETGNAAVSIDRLPQEVQQPLIDPLTNRERDILELLAKRWQNKEIADHLCVATETVKSHLKNVYQKLDVSNRLQAVRKACQIGLLPRE